MSDESDLLNGYEEIARFLHWPPYTAKRRALDGLIPTFKVGRIVCARRSSLNTWLAEQEAKARRTEGAAA